MFKFHTVFVTLQYLSLSTRLNPCIVRVETLSFTQQLWLGLQTELSVVFNCLTA